MSTIEIRDIRESASELLTEELSSIRGGSHIYPTPSYPENPQIPSMESIQELLEGTYAQFPDIFSEMPGHPGGGCFPHLNPLDPAYSPMA